MVVKDQDDTEDIFLNVDILFKFQYSNSRFIHQSEKSKSKFSLR